MTAPDGGKPDSAAPPVQATQTGLLGVAKRLRRAGQGMTALDRRLSPNLVGASWMVASAVLYTAHMTIAKAVSSHYPAAVIATVNAMIAFVFILPMVIRAGRSVWVVRQPWMMGLRSTFGALGTVLGFYAIRDLPLSMFNAISFSRTLFVVVVAALMLGETVGPRRWGATIVGFIGVLIIVRPQGEVSAGVWSALATSVSFAGAVVLVKALSRQHQPLTLLLYANCLNALFTAVPAILAWKTPEGLDWLLLTGMAGFGAASQYCYISGMTAGEASFVSNMDYLRLPFTLIADLVIFSTLPSPWIWPGAALIIGSTVYISLRERQLHKAVPAGAPPSPEGP